YVPGVKEKKSQAQLMVEAVEASGCELFHDPDTNAYATLPVGDHQETYRVRSRPFHLWLRKLFRDEHDKTPGAQAVTDALNMLESKALFDGGESPVYVRLAEHEGKVYLDLCNDTWEAVEVDETGWRVVNGPPVKFRRAKGMAPLPTPTKGGGLNDLR